MGIPVRRSILMGTASRRKPTRLGEKILHIRNALGLSQNEMIARMGLTEELSQYNISTFERDVREPSLPVLLQYARAAGVCMDVLVDDELDLPARLPSIPKHEGAPRKLTSKKSPSIDEEVLK
jgi:transcriptional regulator with XRE-family HTH domain